MVKSWIIIQRSLLVSIVAALAAVVLAGCVEYGCPELVTIVRPVDGDTLIVAYGQLQFEVRIRGVDCPEWNEPGGREASEFARELVAGRKARLVYPDKGRVTDKHKRHLAFVDLLDEEPGSFIDFGAEMIRAGLCSPSERFPSPRHDLYQNLRGGD